MDQKKIGRILSNRYQLVELVGQGAMGRVYAAKDLLLGGVDVAAKFLAQSLSNQKMRDRFEREATTCALLGQRSIHIVRVTDYGVDEDEVPYYIMEYLKGESLSDLINRQPIPLPQFLSLTRQICLGLQCAHQGIPIDGEVYSIIHRDIKPSNILITHDDRGELAKILDFGIAKMLQANIEETQQFMGTLAYSSPEQMEGQELDCRSDIYSLGIMMFQMLTGKMPIHADTHSFIGWYKAHHHHTPRSLAEANSSVTNIPKALESLVMSCIAKSPSDRPQSIQEILKTLEPLEDRYSRGPQIAGDIRDLLDNPPKLTPKPSLLSATSICRLAQWPPDKPLAEIVFYNRLRTTKELLATLWVMLPQLEIDKRLVCIRFNQFLFLPSPHPALLWLTVLYNREYGPRWLPCYLDLATTKGQQMAELLGDVGLYRILFFAQEQPQKCVHVLKSTIAATQCKQLQEWVKMAKVAPPTSRFNFSKSILKSELERLKPQIIMKLKSISTDSGSDLSGLG
jgi:serine/threonine-protein kinase